MKRILIFCLLYMLSYNSLADMIIPPTGNDLVTAVKFNITKSAQNTYTDFKAYIGLDFTQVNDDYIAFVDNPLYTAIFLSDKHNVVLYGKKNFHWKKLPKKDYTYDLIPEPDTIETFAIGLIILAIFRKRNGYYYGS